MSYIFTNDYSEGAHPSILKALAESNFDQESGYGNDSHTINTIALIRNLVQDDKADVHLISGGTQTNLIAISAFLRPHEACIAASSGHIAVHETGAIEATGHKICTVPSHDGKLRCEDIENVLKEHVNEHMVSPKLVYISNPTELGTVYSKKELEALKQLCNQRNLRLYCDGARLGTVLCQSQYNLTLADMYTLTDAFFIGGTKNGALLGEILVIQNDALKSGIRHIIKQRGALLAKGRILGIQFEKLFENALYTELAENAMRTARQLTLAFHAFGYRFLVKPQTNQIFPILENSLIEILQKDFEFYVWEEMNADSSAIRLVTSWATTDEAVDALINALEKHSPRAYGSPVDQDAPGVEFSGTY
jgi:threonine aldolase